MASKRTAVRMLVTGSVRTFAAVAHVQGKKTALTWDGAGRIPRRSEHGCRAWRSHEDFAITQGATQVSVTAKPRLR